MKRFSEFLTESPWMYHGIPHEIQGQHVKIKDYDTSIDRIVGAHFAADPIVAQKFAKGLYRGDNKTGEVYRTKAPPRSKLYKLTSYKGFDQHNIGSFISGTTFSLPENKHMFKEWIKKSRMIDDNMAEEIYGLLSSGKAPADKKFGVASSKGSKSFRSYMHNFDSGLLMAPHPEFRKEVVKKFVNHMKSKGYQGIVYRNTSPRETEGARSRKSYIIFEQENHPLEKVSIESYWRKTR